MSKPLLQTTIVGSLPKPAWLAQPNQLWAPWLLQGEILREAQRDATRLVIRDQERAGIDVICDGEMRRFFFVQTFYEKMAGLESLPPLRTTGLYAYDSPPR